MDRRALRVLIFVAFCLFLAATAWWVVRWAEKLPDRLAMMLEQKMEAKAQEMREKFLSVANFEPKIRVNEKVISETTRQIADVAVLEKRIEVTREFNHTWAGSTKKLRLKGDFAVKVGFGLLDRFEIVVEKDRRRVVMSPATILSVEQVNLKVETLENGLWNPVSAGDMEVSVTALKEMARKQGGPLLQQAEAEFAERLRAAMGSDVEIVPTLL